jgi:malic enzyme
MLLASARAVAAAVPDEKVAAGELYPPVRDLRAVSLRVAAAVAAAARDEGVARAEGLPNATGDAEFDERAMRDYIAARMWWPTGGAPEGWPGL